jgi:hypothetical protein
MCMSDFRRGFGLEIRFIHLLQVVTTSNYNNIVNFHTLKITAAHARSFQSTVTSRFTVTASYNGDSSASALTSLLSGEYPAILNCTDWVFTFQTLLKLT